MAWYFVVMLIVGFLGMPVCLVLGFLIGSRASRGEPILQMPFHTIPPPTIFDEANGGKRGPEHDFPGDFE